MLVSKSGPFWGDGHKVRQSRFADYLRQTGAVQVLEITLGCDNALSTRWSSTSDFAPISVCEITALASKLRDLNSIAVLDTYRRGIDQKLVKILDSFNLDKVIGYGEECFEYDFLDGFIFPYNEPLQQSRGPNLFQSADYLLVDLDYTNRAIGRREFGEFRSLRIRSNKLVCFLGGGAIAPDIRDEFTVVLNELVTCFDIACCEIISSDLAWFNELEFVFSHRNRSVSKFVFQPILTRELWNETLQSAHVCIGNWGGSAVARALRGVSSINLCVADNQRVVRQFLKGCSFALDSKDVAEETLTNMNKVDLFEVNEYRDTLYQKLVKSPERVVNILEQL